MANGRLPATIAQQVFTITSGVAGGLAGFVLASRLAGKQEVDTTPVVLAAALSAAATFGAVFLVETDTTSS